jgi:dTDP-4-amino-4,6-dideoxygalactose transaminase
MREQTVVAELMLKMQHSSLAALERALCGKTGAARCVVTGGWREAMLLALRAAGVFAGQGAQSVACPGLGDPALLHTVLYAGAAPIFADVNPDTWLMDSGCLGYAFERCTRMRQTLPAAVIASNLFGMPCDYPALEALCGRYGVTLIEDMRGCTGGRVGGRRCGSFGDYSVLTLPGGMVSAVFCRNGDGEERLRRYAAALTQPDILSADMSYEWLLHAQREEEARSRFARDYRMRLGGAVRFQQAGEGFAAACGAFVIALGDREAAGAAKERLARRGLGTDTPLPVPLHQLAGGPGHRGAMLSHTEGIADKLVALPLHAYLNSRTIARIIATVTDS